MTMYSVTTAQTISSERMKFRLRICKSRHKCCTAPSTTRREAECDHASRQSAEIQSRINHMNLVDLKPLMEKLNELVAEEMRLAHLVTGAGYTNELGIVVPARPPI